MHAMEARAAVAAAFLIFAGAAPAQVTLRTVTGSTNGEAFGDVVVDVGDIDGDGFPDFAVASPEYDSFGSTDAGRARFFSGKLLSAMATLNGSIAGDELGFSICGLDDVSGDGRSDVAIASPFHDWVPPGGGPAVTDAGLVQVYSITGSAFSPQYIIPLTGNLGAGAAGDQFGHALASPGDLNGDGYPELAVGVPQKGGLGIGYVDVFDANAGVLLFSIPAPGGTSGEFGSSMDAAGDVNGDGVGDLVVGQPQWNGIGRAHVFALSSSGATLLHTYAGTSSGEEFGYAVAGIGLMNNSDSVPDVVVGGPGVGAGLVRVYSGSTLVHTLGGDSAGDRFGASVRGLGRWGADQWDDYVVGAPLDDDNGSDCGSARMFSGNNPTVFETVYGDSAGDLLGTSVSGIGSLSGDRRDEAVAGAPGGASVPGYARIYSRSCPTPAPYCTSQVSVAGCQPTMTYAGTSTLTGADDFYLGATGVPSGEVGLMFWGLCPDDAPWGGGTLCVLAPLVNTTGQNSGGTGTCGGSFSYHFTQSYMATYGLTPGTLVFAQYSYRDVGSPGDFASTDALVSTICP